jgi:hypothetical protein
VYKCVRKKVGIIERKEESKKKERKNELKEEKTSIF